VGGRLREATGLGAVALTGGVFLNALLTAGVGARRRGDGFGVYRHGLAPPTTGVEAGTAGMHGPPPGRRGRGG